MITLLTKDSKRTGNAIIYGGQDAMGDVDYVFLIETDFGNRNQLTAKELNQQYTLGRVCSYEEWFRDREELRRQNQTREP